MTTAAPETAKTNTEAAPAATTDPKAEAAAPAAEPKPEAKPAAEVAQKGTEEKKPEAKPLELKLPEGSYLAAEAVERIAALAKEQGLSQEQAQAELNKESDLVKSFVEGEKAKLAKQADVWVDETRKDPEIGGEKFAANAEMAKRVVQRFGTEAFKKALNDSGLGNHPELVRVFVRIGRAMTEDQLVTATGNPTAPKSPAEVLYGDTSNNKEK